jgi:hypothetical protein
MKTVEANIGSSTISIGAMPVIVGSCARARFCGLGVGMGRGILLVSHIHRDFFRVHHRPVRKWIR